MIVEVCSTAICLFFPKQLFALFTIEDVVFDLGVIFLHIIIHFFCSVFLGAFQSIVTGYGFVEPGFAIGILDGVICKIGMSLLFQMYWRSAKHAFGGVGRWHVCCRDACACEYFLSGK